MRPVSQGAKERALEARIVMRLSLASKVRLLWTSACRRQPRLPRQTLTCSSLATLSLPRGKVATRAVPSPTHQRRHQPTLTVSRRSTKQITEADLRSVSPGLSPARVSQCPATEPPLIQTASQRMLNKTTCSAEGSLRTRVTCQLAHRPAGSSRATISAAS